MDRIFIFDTTLRDGEQSPGAAMTLAEKLRLADMLDAAGVDVIEAGFPAASEGDFAAVVAVAERLTSASAAALARAAENDIRKAGEALRKARKPRIHTFIATSALHMEHKLRLSPEQVLEKIDFSVRLAREYADDVEWSCEDGTRSERAFLCTAIETAIAAGATVINV
ncbi:MAG: 2-isopropylmalate synthase, partial [Proteobacteria bacterium]|nr:2-isopropylmalate synthase [Pseudomonadota bacterium]